VAKSNRDAAPLDMILSQRSESIASFIISLDLVA
jgi:hypothetical protein